MNIGHRLNGFVRMVGYKVRKDNTVQFAYELYEGGIKNGNAFGFGRRLYNMKKETLFVGYFSNWTYSSPGTALYIVDDILIYSGIFY